jgi:hypothetical protein
MIPPGEMGMNGREGLNLFSHIPFGILRNGGIVTDWMQEREGCYGF